MSVRAAVTHLRLLAVAWAAIALLLSISAQPHSAHATGTTAPAKTYWHKVGNDRFRAYDVGGMEFGGFKVPPAETHTGYPYGPSKPGYNSNSWEGKSNKGPNKRYAQRVDWPVTFIFRNNATVDKVKRKLAEQGLGSEGGPMFLSLVDNPQHMAHNVYDAWDKDRGLKEVRCSGLPRLPNIVVATNHIRLYADEHGQTKNTRDDRLYNPYWGFYVLGTTHKDHMECSPFGTWFGKSEQAENHIADLAKKAWGAGRVSEDRYDMKNREPWREQGDHKWENNGMATVVRVGRMPTASSSINPPDDDPNPGESEGGGEEGGGEEGPPPPPPPDPAKQGDVDGDDKADLVTLHTSGNAYTYRGSNGSGVASFSGTMDPAVFDGYGFHVVGIGDVNADNRADMVTVHSAGVIFTFMGQPDGSFGFYKEAGKITPGYRGQSGQEPIGVADVTGEGYADLVAFNPSSGGFSVYPGNYKGTFGAAITTAGGLADSALFDREGTWFLGLADLDGNGSAEAVGMGSDGEIDVHSVPDQGAESAAAGPAIDPMMADGTGSEPIGMGDVDGDGKDDLAVLGEDGQVAVYGGTAEKDGSGHTKYLDHTPVKSLSAQASSLLGSYGADFAGLLDVSGDGRADLVKVLPNGEVQLAKGKADLTFEAPSKWIGGVPSNRFGVSPAHELAQEAPYLRRYGCEADGCAGLPKTTDSDVDGDRRADLVTLDSGGTAHVYRAMGDLPQYMHATSFAGTADPALFDGTGHHVIDVADVDGDGQSDKVTLHDNGNVYVYPGKGDGTFGSGVVNFSGGMAPGPYSPEGYEPIAVADVTGDRRGDLLAFRQGQGVGVYPGNANGTFSAAVDSLSQSNSARFDQTGLHFLDAVDVTGDRRADLVAAGAEDDTIRVFKGHANGTLSLDGVSTLALKLDEGDGQELIGLGDVNGDGRADLATLAQGSVNVFAGRASGEFLTEGASGPSPSATSFAGTFDSNLFDQEGEEVVGLLDQNGDRKADLVTVPEGGGAARIYRGRANFTFKREFEQNELPGLTSVRFNSQPGHELVAEKPAAFRAGCTRSDCLWPPIPFIKAEHDVDGDYRSDLVTVTQAGSVDVFAGSRLGFKTDPVASLEGQIDSALLDGEGHYAIDVSDVNDDDLSDLITVEDDGKVKVHLGEEGRTFAEGIYGGVTIPPAMNGAGPYEPIGVADVTGDGFDDLVVFEGPRYGDLLTYEGRIDGTFSPTPVGSSFGGINSASSDGKGDYFLGMGDVDGDGHADFATVDHFGDVAVYRGLSNGSLTPTSSGSLTIDPIMDDGSGQEPIGLGDVNGDGRSDLLTLDGSSVKLYAGLENGRFATWSMAYSTGVNSSLFDGEGEDLLGLLDHDGDGHADLVSISDEGDLRVYAGQSNGALAAPQVQSVEVQTVRHDPAGSEFVVKEPLPRVAGCEPHGCFPLPEPSWEPGWRLTAISCASEAYCLAVGRHDDPEEAEMPPVMTWDGEEWSMEEMPRPQAAQGEVSLTDVSCAKPSVCRVSGSYGDGTKQLAFVSRFAGGQWSRYDIVPPPGLSSYLATLSCGWEAAQEIEHCDAAGELVNGTTRLAITAVMSPASGAWTYSPWYSPKDPWGSGKFVDMSCVSATRCMAVGHYGYDAQQALAVEKDGGGWTVYDTPSMEQWPGSTLTGVFCMEGSPAQRCMAVGSRANAEEFPLALQWGSLQSEWTHAGVPIHPTAYEARALGVSCLDLDTCALVGAGTGESEPLAQHWQQESWAWQQEGLNLPNAEDAETVLEDVSCSGFACMAVGHYVASPENQRLPVIMRWEVGGSGWEGHWYPGF